MILSIYSLRDKLGGDFAPTFEARNDDVALRVVLQMLKRNRNIPLSDLELWKFAEFDNEAGVMTLCEKACLKSSFAEVDLVPDSEVAK